MSTSVRVLSALLSGSLLALAFPGIGDQGWLAFVALVPLLVASGGIRWQCAGALGFTAGLIFWLVTISWVAPTMVRYGSLPWPLAILILLGLAGYLALYPAAFCLLLSRNLFRSGTVYVVVAASLWVAFEFLRTSLFTGFPWNLLGYSQHGNLPLIQMAAVTGVYGVSFVVMAVNAGLARTLLAPKNWHTLVGPLGTAGLFVVGALGYSWLWPLPDSGKPAIPVAVVQGNIDQGIKWDPAWEDKTVALYKALTVQAARARPRFIVWPETAVPFFLREDPRRAKIEAVARAAGAFLVVGAPDRHAGKPQNSAFLVGPDGRMLGRYAKRHLVPFGEYVPLKKFLFFVNVVAGGAIGEFAPGREATVFSSPIGRLGVTICYEAIFPAEVREFFLGGADFLVNITNDAWFGRSAAPAQHLAMAAFRAVENRAYLIRAANTGISAIVAPDGRIVQAAEIFTPRVLSGTITPRTGVSLYTRYGSLFAWGTVAVALAAALAALRPISLPKRRRGHDPVPAGAPSLRGTGWGRRGLLAWLALGAGGVGASLFVGLRSFRADGAAYQEVARWQIPGGEGRFIAVGPEPTPDELRALGARLREEFRRLDNAVVMVFDDSEAARQVLKGSRIIGEERFRAALFHQRAMFLKNADRGEHALTIYDRYPAVRETVRY